MPGSTEVTLFSKCAGLNDSEDVFNAVIAADGTAEITDCQGIKLLEDGKITFKDSLMQFGSVLPASVTAVSGGVRLICQAGFYLYVYECGVFNQVLIAGAPVAVTGIAKFAHTQLCIYIDISGIVYKLPNQSFTLQLAMVGQQTDPVTSKVYNAVPSFDGGFVFSSRFLTFKDDFIQYSEVWNYDLFNIANNFIGVGSKILNMVHIPDVVVAICADKVVILSGTDIEDCTYVEYALTPKANTLVSGYNPKVGFAAMFCASDGIYAVSADGKLQNITAPRFDRSFDEVFVGAAITYNCYIVKSENVEIVYDFNNKAAVKNTEVAVTGITYFGGSAVVSVGNALYSLANTVTSSSCSVTFAYTDCAARFKKKYRSLYIGGKFTGAITVTVTGADGQEHSITQTKNSASLIKFSGFNAVKDHYIKVKITFVGTVFELGSIKAIVIPVQDN